MFWNRRTYLDYAAGVAGNPSSPHEEGRRARHILEDARMSIARLVEVQPDDVIFTSGATESNALAILGHVRALRLLAGADTAGRNTMHVLYLPSSHASIVENMKLLIAEGIAVEPLPVRDGRVDTEALANMIRVDTVLVSMDAVCGETGIVWNTRDVATVLRKARTDNRQIILHVDASQSAFTEKISRAHFDADLLTFDASKVGAVRGVGVLVGHRTIPLVPLYKGGGQERGLRSGSESPELAKKFAAALRAAARDRDTFRASAEVMRARLVKEITATISNVQVNEGRSQAPHILNLSLVGRDTDYLVALLDEAGFAVSTRSACETDSEEGSRAVFVLTQDSERARATLRVSWNAGVSSEALQRFAKALIRAVAFIDNSAER